MWNVHWELCLDDLQPREKPCVSVRPLSPTRLPPNVPRAGPSSRAGPSTGMQPSTSSLRSSAGAGSSGRNTSTGATTNTRSDKNSESHKKNFYRNIKVTISSSLSNESYHIKDATLTMRRFINEFMTNEQVFHNREELLQKIKRVLRYKRSMYDFRRRLFYMGYMWFCTKNPSVKYLLLENTALRLHRQEYLRAIKQFRAEGRPIVYLDKYVEYTTLREGLKCTAFTLSAISGTEVLPNLIDIFEIELNNKYREERYKICKDWFCTKAIPKIPPKAVIVLVNVPYRDLIANPPPKSNAKKVEMESWLSRNEVSFDSNMFKPQLFKLISTHKDKVKKYAIDEWFKEDSSRDHVVLRAPLQHIDLNMTHLFWVQMLKRLKPDPNTFRDKVFHLIQNILCATTVDMIQYMQEQIKDFENEYEKGDFAIDVLTDQVELVCKPKHEDDECAHLNLEAISVDDADLTPPLVVINSDEEQ